MVVVENTAQKPHRAFALSSYDNNTTRKRRHFVSDARRGVVSRVRLLFFAPEAPEAEHELHPAICRRPLKRLNTNSGSLIVNLIARCVPGKPSKNK